MTINCWRVTTSALPRIDNATGLDDLRLRFVQRQYAGTCCTGAAVGEITTRRKFDLRIDRPVGLYQAFFDRYGACRMARQIRAWDFGAFETDGSVRVQLFCLFSGVAVSDVTGTLADQPAWFPRSSSNDIWLTFTRKDGAWRITQSDPALPNFRDILSFSAGPYDAFPLGQDR